MTRRGLFLVAYACSGLAGLVYEVSWTRLLTLELGHTTAAASTVLAAFMGGLAGGSALGSRHAPRVTPRRAIKIYALLEVAVVALAVALPFELAALQPLLARAYQDGAGGAAFAAARVAAAFGVLFVPALALGATFPMAARWFVEDGEHPGPSGGRLYAANTAGAAVGAFAAGFILIPAIGVSGAIGVGVAASAVSIAVALVIATRPSVPPGVPAPAAGSKPARAGRKAAAPPAAIQTPAPLWPAAAVLGATGFATFVLEIAWTRVFAMTIGPSTYAVAATITTFIAGLAIGSAAGSVIAGRARQQSWYLIALLAGAALAASWSSAAAGRSIPLAVAADLASAPGGFADWLVPHSLLVAATVGPVALLLGAAFPLALDLAGSRSQPVARRLGLVYAVNTLASVGGALAAGFFLIPRLGLEGTLHLAGGVLAAAAAGLLLREYLRARREIRRAPAASGWLRGAATVAAAAAIAALLPGPSWDRELLASGVYKYARRVAPGLDLESALKAGRLLYDRDGAAGTVSVKELTGARSLAIDGKVDASTAGDMITQKTLAHLPLLLHPDPRDVAIIGLGSGVTAGAALVHPVRSVDVLEISPEVIEASAFFDAHNRRALSDPRVRLIVGDGRSHLALASRRYDVIVSEPSNPWMAGVAALFTREFFAAARARLRPGGVICQWAHTYDISEADLRSIVATFASVFPESTMWLIGDGDLLLVGSSDPVEPRLELIERGWRRAGVAGDLRETSVAAPFALLSMYIGGPDEVRRFAGTAPLQRDDRMALEFSGPRAVNGDAAATNVAALRGLLAPDRLPAAIARARAAAGPDDWRARAALLLGTETFALAYESYAEAFSRAPDAAMAEGLARSAIAGGRAADAAATLDRAARSHPDSPAVAIALSKLMAAQGRSREAVQVAEAARQRWPREPLVLEQLASIYADSGDAPRLEPVALRLHHEFPERAGAWYYAAAHAFLRQQHAEALRLAGQAVILEPAHAAAHNLIGAIHATLGQRDRARAAFETALRYDPRDGATYTNLALLEIESGNNVRAARLFAEALSLDPESPAARQGLERTRRSASAP